jgi:hypothetical protein
MSEGQSQRSVALSTQHRQEAEVAAAEKREQAAAETAAMAAQVARLVMVELAAARAEVEVAAVVELKALRASSTDSFVSADDDRDNKLKPTREAAPEQAAQWAVAHPQWHRGGSPDGRGRVPDGGGSPDRRGRAGDWVDGDHGLYRRRDSPSPDRYHGHHGIQAIVRDVGPGGGWPTLTKTNYVEWAAVMRVRLQVRHMWEAVRYATSITMRIDRRWMPSLLQSHPRCSSRFLRSGLPRRLGMPSLRHASAATAPTRPCYRHFVRSERT